MNYDALLLALHRNEIYDKKAYGVIQEMKRIMFLEEVSEYIYNYLSQSDKEITESLLRSIWEEVSHKFLKAQENTEKFSPNIDTLFRIANS